MYAETPHAPRMALEGPSAFFWLFCCLREYSGLRFSDTRAIHRLFCLLPLSFCPQRKSALLTITPDHYCGRIDTARMETRKCCGRFDPLRMETSRSKNWSLIQELVLRTRSSAFLAWLRLGSTDLLKKEGFQDFRAVCNQSDEMCNSLDHRWSFAMLIVQGCFPPWTILATNQ